jgi:hypothetical protein
MIRFLPEDEALAVHISTLQSNAANCCEPVRIEHWPSVQITSTRLATFRYAIKDGVSCNFYTAVNYSLGTPPTSDSTGKGVTGSRVCQPLLLQYLLFMTVSKAFCL